MPLPKKQRVFFDTENSFEKCYAELVIQAGPKYRYLFRGVF